MRAAVMEDRIMCATADSSHERFVNVGTRSDLARLLAEYGLDDADVEDLITTRTPIGVGGAPGPLEYRVHESLLRSHGEFPCAGDAEALSFCRRSALGHHRRGGGGAYQPALVCGRGG
jgi:hypothetical protein